MLLCGVCVNVVSLNKQSTAEATNEFEIDLPKLKGKPPKPYKKKKQCEWGSEELRTKTEQIEQVCSISHAFVGRCVADYSDRDGRH